ncbi:MAG: hypothetical protein EAZ55_04525 [Cytophagales bacterium]|nr:MAG: hypothetical protein EAZ55_04525 [Cytophagales bacterium]
MKINNLLTLKSLWVWCFLITLAGNLKAQEITTLKGQGLFGSMIARQIGPAIMSGRVTDIDGVNNDPKIIYVATAGGGVWKSINGGGSFRPIFDKYIQSIGKVTVDQRNPQTIWVGTGEVWVRNSTSVGNGLYKSTNGGTDWQLMGLPKSERISDIIIDPNNSDIVYVGVMGALWSDSEERGVYKTEDGGKTWNKILYVDAKTGCADMSIDAKNPNVIYASMWEFRRMPYKFLSGGKGSALYKSTDGGKTWNKIHNGLPQETLGRIAIESAPSNPNVLYASVEVANKDLRGMYRSDDAGNNWKKVGNSFNLSVRPFYFSRLTIDPKNDSIVYKAGLNMIVTIDGGNSYREPGGMHSDIHAFWVNPQNTDIVYVGTDGGVYRTMDKGYNFEMINDLPVSQFYHVSVDDEMPYNVYGGLQDNQCWYGPSSRPGGVENRDWKGIFGGDGFHTIRHPIHKDYIFCEFQGGEMKRYSISTKQMKDVKPYAQKGDPKLRFNWNSPIHISPNNPNRIYYGSQFVHTSEDLGETWKKISPDLTTNDPIKQDREGSGGLTQDNSSAESHCTIFAIAESPKDEKIVWAGTDDGNLQVTADGGAKWTNVVANVVGLPKNTWVSHIEPSRYDKNTAYVVFEGHMQGDMKPYVYKTTDLGKTWTSLVTADLPIFARVIKEDLKNPNLLFLGTELGLFVTIDGGANWTQFTNNMPPVPVFDMVIHPRDNDLVMATHGRGIIIIDDISPLQQMNKEVFNKEVHFFETKPTLIGNPIGAEVYSNPGEYVGASKSNSVKIIYYLKKRHNFGDMFLEILDANGKVISKLPASKNIGLNIVEWQPNLKVPKTAIGQTITFGGLFAPAAPEGTYTVKMTKGKETYTSTLVLQLDSKMPYSKEEIQERQRVGMRLYEMMEELAYLADNVQTMQREAQDRAQKDPKLAKNLEAFAKELDEFNQTLVITKGNWYTETQEDKLRERISNLYMAVWTYPGKPGNAQVESLTILEEELSAAKKKGEELKTKKLPSINSQLSKAGQPEIKLLTWEEFKAKD